MNEIVNQLIMFAKFSEASLLVTPSEIKSIKVRNIRIIRTRIRIQEIVQGI